MSEKKTFRLKDYLSKLRKDLKSSQINYWRNIRTAQETFQKELITAMREYETVEYSDKRVPGALGEAAKSFNERYEAAYRAFGEATREALQRFHKNIESLIGT